MTILNGTINTTNNGNEFICVFVGNDMSYTCIGKYSSTTVPWNSQAATMTYDSTLPTGKFKGKIGESTVTFVLNNNPKMKISGQLTSSVNPPIDVVGELIPLASDSKIFLLPETAQAPNLLQTLNTQGLQGYFGYGSNLSLPQMLFRCPDSPFICVAVLEGWRWAIVSGVATIIKSPSDVVYGYLYLLTPKDEKSLDNSEGTRYDKVYMPVDIGPGIPDRQADFDFKALVYIHKEVAEGPPRAEYINRLNAAFSHAVTKGIPPWYVEKYIQYKFKSN